MNLDPLYLLVVLVGSAIGMGAFLYGKRTAQAKPLLIGVSLMGASYLVASTGVLALLTAGLTALLVTDTTRLAYRLMGPTKAQGRIESIE